MLPLVLIHRVEQQKEQTIRMEVASSMILLLVLEVQQEPLILHQQMTQFTRMTKVQQFQLAVYLVVVHQKVEHNLLRLRFLKMKVHQLLP